MTSAPTVDGAEKMTPELPSKTVVTSPAGADPSAGATARTQIGGSTGPVTVSIVDQDEKLVALFCWSVAFSR
jgi:hypothetical protein